MTISPTKITLMDPEQCARYLESDETLVDAIDRGCEMLGADTIGRGREGPIELDRLQAKSAILALQALVGFETSTLGEPVTWHAKTGAHFLKIFEEFGDQNAHDGPQLRLVA